MKLSLKLLTSILVLATVNTVRPVNTVKAEDLNSSVTHRALEIQSIGHELALHPESRYKFFQPNGKVIFRIHKIF